MASPAISFQPVPLSIATPLRDSMTFTSTKGLLNGPGQNNCFLNSAVQVLWHLDIFRRSFRDLSGHACMADSCIFCALKELFSQLQFSTETALPPDVLRRALAESFFDQNRFQLGFMDDAAECFENMLLRIHTHIAHGEDEDMCNARHCIPHQKFAMTLVEQSICGSCGASSEPLSYTQMVHYISTSTLVYQVRTNAGRPNPTDTFGQLLQKAGSMGDVRTCPSACGAVIQIGRTLMNFPEIVSIGLVWNSERPTLEHIMEVFSTIGTTLRLGDLFNTVKDNKWTETSVHNLVGVVTYYGKHYSTFFFHTKLRVWIYFDDATVREVGPRWEQVVEKCRKGRYQPLLLLYALPDGTPVNTENAPKQIIPFYNDKNQKLQHSLIRRSVTPSPEKPLIGNTRRAITPNPDGSAMIHKPPIPRPCNDYQNLSVIQKNINSLPPLLQGVDVVDDCGLLRKEPEYVTRKSLDFGKPHVNIHRTLSNGSSSGVEMSIPDHMNLPRRRDSGNWSGDRNSASSASSTTMENPYLYLVGKVPHGNGSVPGSPTRIKSDSSSGSSGVYDAGYDSYSLSSNDSSSMSTLQHLMKMGHLAKIPEDYNNAVHSSQNSQSCDVLCDEADELLVKSRQLEDEHDLVLALALCNAAATKARAAMNAPYNNPQTLTLARMKHNTCIMRARSLHRRMTQTQSIQNVENPPEIRHTREGSSSSGRHSRQNSRDKGQHSRQNSKELLVQERDKSVKPMKSIEIYATLPKRKDTLKAKLNAINIQDEECVMFEKPPNRESRSIFSRSKNKDAQKNKEKRSRSEDRNKITRDFSIAPEIVVTKDTLKKAKDEKDEKKDKDGKSKKQHKIRRKLLMGGLIKRKNRSMPDLTDADSENLNSTKSVSATVDDSNLGLKKPSESGISGYLSEGHLEFSGNITSPNLERSKLMRKSFHCSAGKILTVAKVPPPPPLRTTSQLSKSKSEVSDDNGKQIISEYQNLRFGNLSPNYDHAPVSLPYYHNSSYESSFSEVDVPTTLVTQADVHQEQTPPSKASLFHIDSGVDEVDCLPNPSHLQLMDLPPYPSPACSVIHSRQASEDFPPPPPPLDLSALDEYLPKPPTPPAPDSLLAQLQNKRQQILSPEHADTKTKLLISNKPSGGDTWLRELQAKQAAIRIKKNEESGQQAGIDEINTQKYLPGEAKIKSVRDLASKFENTEKVPISKQFQMCNKSVSVPSNESVMPSNIINGVVTLKKRDEEKDCVIAPAQIAEEIREVEMINAAMNKSLNLNQEAVEYSKKHKIAKKKSVSFCDQVILVATAEEQEDDSYIPNPILERVLRSAVNKPETEAIRQEILNLRDTNEIANHEHIETPPSVEMQPQISVRRNSLENLLNNPNAVSFETCYNQRQYYEQPINVQQQHILSANCNPTNSNNYYPQNGYNNPSTPLQYNNQSSPMVNTNYNSQPTYYHQPPPNLINGSSGYYGLTSQSNAPLSPTSYNSQNNSPMYVSRQQDPQYVSRSMVPPNESQYKQYQCPPQKNFNGNSPYTSQISPPQSSHYAPIDSSQLRPSPHMLIPMNSPAYATYHANRNNMIPDHNSQQYASSPRVSYNQPIRQSTPSPMGYAYQHPPSPSPSTMSSATYTSQQNVYRGTPNCGSPYERYPPTGITQQNYNTTQRIDNENDKHLPIQRVNDVYQRVPPLHSDLSHPTELQAGHATTYSPYQQIMTPKHQLMLKKSVSFEPGTKGGCESPVPKAVVTPIIVNNANNSIPTDKTKCNLCRKKNVVAANLYCTDCEFYMSRFKPRS